MFPGVVPTLKRPGRDRQSIGTPPAGARGRILRRSLSPIGPFVLGLAAILALGACDRFGSVPIGKILANPRDYDGVEVVVAGTVTESLNLLVRRTFTLRDKSGEITVVTSRSVPKIGQTIRVKGRVEQAFSIGTDEVVIINETAPR